MRQNIAALWHLFDEEDELYDEESSSSPSSGEPPPVTFPTTFLKTRAQIALGADLSADPLTWGWEDITRFVRTDLGISLTVGRRDESTKVTTGSGQIKLDNRDGRFSRRKPTGPYYGLLSKNTPIWITVDAGSGEKTRMEMFINEWPTRWDQSGNDSTVTIRCAGILRRLAQGQVLKSALRRSIGFSGPDGYWPMEDGSLATTVASGLTAGPPMTVSGTVDFAATPGPAGSAPLCDGLVDDVGSLLVPDTLADGTSSWTMSFVFRPAALASGLLLAWYNPGSTYPLHLMHYSAEGDTLQVLRYDSAGSSFTTAGTSTVVVDQYNHLIWQQHQSAGDVAWSLYINGSLDSSGTYADTSGPPRAVAITPDMPELFASGLGPVSFGHFALWSGAVDATGHYDAMLGYAGEMAHVRIPRLCAEEGVPIHCLASVSPTLGAQGTGSFLELVREAEAASLGVLYEKRWGLSYQSLAERYNQPVGLALDFDAGQIAEPPEPADDDQRVVNKFTATRTDGSSYTAELTTGEMGTGSQGPGIYDDSGTFNVETDDQLPSQAGWRRHLGTIDEDRWPSIALNFAHDPDLIDAWTSLAYGSRLTAANPPDQVAPDALDQIIEGYRESWDQFIWTAALNCSPASAYRAYVAGSTDGNLGRVDAGDSTLAADVTSTATTLSVASPGALWRSGAVNFDIGVGGERMTVTDIAPTLYDTFTRSVSNGWGAGEVNSWVVDLGTASDFSVNGSVGIMSHSTIANHSVISSLGEPDQDVTFFFRIPVAPTGASAAAIIEMRTRWIDNSNHYAVRIGTDSAGVMTLSWWRRSATVGNLEVLGHTLALDVTHTYGVRFSLDGSDMRAKFWDATTSSEPNWELTIIDANQLVDGFLICLLSIPVSVTNPLPFEFWFDDITAIALHSAQTFTVVRSVNDVVKPQLATVAGFPTKVSLWRPGVIAL